MVECLLTGVVKTYHTPDSLMLSTHSYLSKPFNKPPLENIYFTKSGGTIKPIRFTGKKVGHNKEIEVVCSKCSSDFELFPEPFKTTHSKLQEGNYPCICDNHKQWNTYEYKVRLGRYIEENNYSGLVIPEGILSSSSRVTFYCEEGHLNDKSLDTVFNTDGGCSLCAEGLYGHYHSREPEKDYLYIIQFDNDYIKVGRSFDPNRRIGELIKTSGTENVKVLQLYTGTHKDVFEVEQYLHNTLTSYGYYHHESTWTVETFYKEALQITYDLLKYTLLKETK